MIETEIEAEEKALEAGRGSLVGTLSCCQPGEVGMGFVQGSNGPKESRRKLCHSILQR